MARLMRYKSGKRKLSTGSVLFFLLFCYFVRSLSPRSISILCLCNCVVVALYVQLLLRFFVKFGTATYFHGV